MFSEALRILDENTVKYMIEEMQQEINEKSQELEEKGRELEEKNKQLEIKDNIITLSEFEQPVSAGKGVYLGDGSQTMVREVPNNKYTRQASFILRVSGNSFCRSFNGLFIAVRSLERRFLKTPVRSLRDPAHARNPAYYCEAGRYSWHFSGGPHQLPHNACVSC